MGKIYFWKGCSLYLGIGSHTTLHRHHAIQMCVAVDGDLNLRQSECAAWKSYKSAVIPADVPHQLDAMGGKVALFYIDPEYRRIKRKNTEIPPRDSFLPIESETLAALLNTLLPTQEPVSLEFAGRIRSQFLDWISRGQTQASLDPRVEEALVIMRQLGDVKISLAELASRVYLSPGRFGHLFRDCTGLPFRRYLLWLRLQRAMQSLSDGRNLTETAHSSGFADSAHLSRTFRDMFGMAPVELVKYSQFVQVD